MDTTSVTDYLQQIEDLIPALQLGILPEGTIDSVVTYDLILIDNDFINKVRPLSWR